MDSDVQPIAEERFENKGSYEIKDDKVIFNFELINHYNEVKNLEFSSGQQFELTITDEKGDEVYRYSDGKFFTMALLFKDLNPGESLKWQETWDMTNKEEEKLTSGKYEAKINILARAGESEEKVDESQLTTVIEIDITELKKEEAKQAAKQFLPEDALFSVGDLEGNGTMKIAYISRTDEEIPSVKLQVYNFTGDSHELEYETEFQHGDYPDSVMIGAASENQQAIFVELGLGAHSAATEILVKEDGEYKNVLANDKTDEYNFSQTFKPYPLYSKDINNDGIIEVGVQTSPPETDFSMAGTPWINNWYQWDGKDGLIKVLEEYSRHNEGYRFIVPENWQGKYTIDKSADEGLQINSLHFIYLDLNTENKQKAELMIIHHVPKANWPQQEQRLQDNNKPYVLLGENDENMLVVELGEYGAKLTEENLKVYEKMLLDKENVAESFTAIGSNTKLINISD